MASICIENLIYISMLYSGLGDSWSTLFVATPTGRAWFAGHLLLPRVPKLSEHSSESLWYPAIDVSCTSVGFRGLIGFGS